MRDDIIFKSKKIKDIEVQLGELVEIKGEEYYINLIDTYIRNGHEERKEAKRLKNQKPSEKIKIWYTFGFMVNLFFTVPVEGWSHGIFWAAIWPIYWTRGLFVNIFDWFSLILSN